MDVYACMCVCNLTVSAGRRKHHVCSCRFTWARASDGDLRHVTSSFCSLSGGNTFSCGPAPDRVPAEDPSAPQHHVNTHTQASSQINTQLFIAHLLSPGSGGVASSLGPSERILSACWGFLWEAEAVTFSGTSPLTVPVGLLMSNRCDGRNQRLVHLLPPRLSSSCQPPASSWHRQHTPLPALTFNLKVSSMRMKQYWCFLVFHFVPDLNIINNITSKNRLYSTYKSHAVFSPGYYIYSSAVLKYNYEVGLLYCSFILLLPYISE